MVEPNPRYQLTIASKGVISHKIAYSKLVCFFLFLLLSWSIYEEVAPLKIATIIRRCDLGASQLLQHSGGVARSLETWTGEVLCLGFQ